MCVTHYSLQKLDCTHIQYMYLCKVAPLSDDSLSLPAFVFLSEEVINRIIVLLKEQGDAIDDKVGIHCCLELITGLLKVLKVSYLLYLDNSSEMNLKYFLTKVLQPVPVSSMSSSNIMLRLLVKDTLLSVLLYFFIYICPGAASFSLSSLCTSAQVKCFSTSWKTP